MHISPTHRQRSLRKLTNLLRPGGKLVITLRHGLCDDDRTMYPVTAAEIEQLSRENCLIYSAQSSPSSDTLGRDTVQWETVVLSMPEDVECNTNSFAIYPQYFTDCKS